MASSSEELFALSKVLNEAAASVDVDNISQPLKAVEKAAEQVSRSFGGSWLGYHSCVYYAGFAPPPPGAHFSQEWGLKELYSDMGSLGDWREYDRDAVIAFIFKNAGNPNLDHARETARNAVGLFNSAKSEIMSILSNEIDNRADGFLEKLKAEVVQLEPMTKGEVEQHWAPKGEIITRDMTALGQRTMVPPHIDPLADVASLKRSFEICKAAAQTCTRVRTHKLPMQISRLMIQAQQGA